MCGWLQMWNSHILKILSNTKKKKIDSHKQTHGKNNASQKMVIICLNESKIFGLNGHQHFTT